MDTRSELVKSVAEFANALEAALHDRRTDEAASLLERLTEVSGLPTDNRELLTARVAIQVQRGEVRDALCLLNGLDDEKAPELKAVCLYMMDDPLWESVATSVEESTTDPATRQAMQELLGKEATA